MPFVLISMETSINVGPVFLVCIHFSDLIKSDKFTEEHIQHYSILLKKCACMPVSKFPFKLLQLADRPLASSSSLQGKIRTGLCARFSAEWSNAEYG